MKSRDEIVIIMLQWMRLYTLGSRGSRELKTFLKTRLISSRVDQKLKEKKGEYTGLKGKIRPKISGRLMATIERRSIGGVVAPIFLLNQPRSRRLLKVWHLSSRPIFEPLMGSWAWVDGVVGAFLRCDAVVPDLALNRP